MNLGESQRFVALCRDPEDRDDLSLHRAVEYQLCIIILLLKCADCESRTEVRINPR